jgi:DNA-binding GntR family transcriptional regulator
VQALEDTFGRLDDRADGRRRGQARSPWACEPTVAHDRLTRATLWIHNRRVSPRAGAERALDGSVGRHAKGEALGLIVRQLRDEILDGSLRPGERIHQEAVAARFGTSRLPVREALRQLQNEGLVIVLPNVGARVARLDAGELVEVYLLRERLEPLLVHRSAAAGVPGAQLEAMRREKEWLERNSPDGREAEWLAHDRSLHMASFAGTSLPRLRSIVESLWNVAEQYRRAYLSVRSGSLEPTLLEHRLLLDAMERRDGGDAARVLEMHIRRTRLGLAAIPELFDA